ncbi:hypothetical protein NIES267_40780 [Calothrix parasitica NIES-267]|uniref:Uncharacterized protein n=1 Tax=Calothrix parasitica NIES-267 TaxID=1973488 RepID=A0A1Z4LTL6_9CYAN|nr:hypothetical protein NIES267_40780 [Calothrix parasitica NIES-267]
MQSTTNTQTNQSKQLKSQTRFLDFKGKQSKIICSHAASQLLLLLNNMV